MILPPPEPQTRRQLLRGAAARTASAALAAAAAPGAGGVAPASAAVAVPAASATIDRLQRLVRVELLLEYCYRQVLSSTILRPDARRAIAPFEGHVEAHVAALEARLAARGATLPPGPASVSQANRFLARRRVGGRLGHLRGDQDALRLLLSMEQVVIGAHFVALLKLSEPALVELSAQIMATGAQHDAVLRLLLPPHKLGSAAPYGLVQGVQ